MALTLRVVSLGQSSQSHTLPYCTPLSSISKLTFPSCEVDKHIYFMGQLLSISVSAIFTSCQQCLRDPVTSNPYQHLVWSVFLMSAILIDLQQYLIGILICTSLMNSDIMHLFFFSSFAIYLSFFVKCVFQFFSYFKNFGVHVLLIEF